ncbi:aldose epimerase family protein [Streptococcus sp. S784/96/1]|uniref:aldose epimerase family protein n=1 Tax=Streptococcus sp. S784/96/1 TaxID=2653499 RepID=UPI0030833A26
MPTGDGKHKNLLLGFDKPSDYGKNTLYAAQTIGRTAGRIAKVQADHVLELNHELIPSGNFLDVTNTPYDFRGGQNLSSAISQNDGFDGAWVVNSKAGEAIVILTDEESGDQLRIFSERQGVVIYMMNSLEDGVYFARDNGLVGKA